MSCTNAIDKANAMMQSKNDSPKNCMMSCFLFPPITFLIPISLARFTERATVRLTKLIHAINKINNAMPESMYEYMGLLASLSPFCAGNSVLMCISRKGCSKYSLLQFITSGPNFAVNDLMASFESAA